MQRPPTASSKNEKRCPRWSATNSSTCRAEAVTSGPTPSPGMTQMLAGRRRSATGLEIRQIGNPLRHLANFRHVGFEDRGGVPVALDQRGLRRFRQADRERSTLDRQPAPLEVMRQLY